MLVHPARLAESVYYAVPLYWNTVQVFDLLCNLTAAANICKHKTYVWHGTMAATGGSHIRCDWHVCITLCFCSHSFAASLLERLFWLTNCIISACTHCAATGGAPAPPAVYHCLGCNCSKS